MNLRARQADCGKPTAARTPTAASRQRQTDKPRGAANQLRPEGRNRLAHCPWGAAKPTAARRPTAAKPRGERQKRQRPDGQLRQSRLPPLKIEFELGAWLKPAIFLGAWQPAWQKQIVGLPTIALGAWRPAWPQPAIKTPTITLGSVAGRGQDQQPHQQSLICSEFMFQTFSETLNSFCKQTNNLLIHLDFETKMIIMCLHVLHPNKGKL